MVIVQTVCAMIGKFGASAVYLNIVFYMNEVYPTTHRYTISAVAMGVTRHGGGATAQGMSTAKTNSAG